MSSADAMSAENPMTEEQKRIVKLDGVAPDSSEAAPSSTINVFPSDARSHGHYGLTDPEANPHKPEPVVGAQQQEQPSGDIVSDDEKYHDAQEEQSQEPASSSSSGKAPVEDANISRSSDNLAQDGSVPLESSEPVQLEPITEVAAGAADTEPETRHEPSASSSASAAAAYTDDASQQVAASDAPHPPHAEAMTQALEEQEMQLEDNSSSKGETVTDADGSSSGAVTEDTPVRELPHPPHAEVVSELLQKQEQELQAAQDTTEGSSSSATTTARDASAGDGSTLGDRATAVYTLDSAPDTTSMQEVDLDSRTGGALDDTASTASVERGEPAASTAAVTASPAPNVRELNTDATAAPAAPAAAAALVQPNSPADQAPTAGAMASTEADEESNESDDDEEEPEQPTQQVPAISGAVSKGNAAAGIRRTIRDTPHDVKAKVDELDMIREFEAKRTSYYDNQIKAHTIYWVAMKEMINRRGHVTETLLKWYNKRLTVYRRFAEGLFERNDSMAGDKKGASMKTAMVGDPFSTRAEPLQQKHYKSNSSKPLGAAGAQQGAGALQDELCAMDCSIATLIEQMCARLEKEVGQVLMQQHTDTLKETALVIREGDQALGTLEQVEAYTLKAYEARHKTAADSMVRPTEYMEQSQGTARRDNTGDMWLADTNYRVAVAQQKASWDSVAKLMSVLFGKLRDAELQRRKYTQAALEEMLRVQSEAWQKLPATHDPVLTCLSRIDVDPQRLEKDLKDETRMWANSEQAQAYNAPPVSELEGDSPPVQTNPEFITSLNDPLESPFVLEAAVLKRKDKGVVKSSWLTTLVVLTSDHFLHMFDCPNLLPGADVKEAFGMILPSIDPSHKFSADKDEKKVAVAPSQSLDLSSHMIGPRGKQTKAEHAMQFHIIEVQENSGFKRFIKSQSQHKASLRTRTKAEMEHWMNLITSLSDARSAAAFGSNSGGLSSQGSAQSLSSSAHA